MLSGTGGSETTLSGTEVSGVFSWVSPGFVGTLQAGSRCRSGGRVVGVVP